MKSGDFQNIMARAVCYGKLSPYPSLQSASMIVQWQSPTAFMSKAPITVKSNAKAPIKKTPKELDFEEKRMQDMFLLLETMFLREETTVKLVLDCLYDIGSINLINQKVRRRPLNRVAKYVARFSKPVFRIFAWRWFTKNCPKLLTDWLYGKVSKF